MPKINLMTHYDLDGVVCEILVRHAMPDKITSTKMVGYNRMTETLKLLLEQSDFLIITDVSMDKERWKMICDAKIKILYIDHHETTIESMPKIIPEHITHLIDQKYCASALVMKFFGKEKYNKNQRLLTKYTNDYDMWILKHVESKILNHYFWECKAQSFYKRFKGGFDSEFVESYKPYFLEEQRKMVNHFEACEKMEINDKLKALIITTSNFTGDVSEHFKDYDIYFIITSKLKLSIRVKNDLTIKFIINKLEEFEVVESCGGHSQAGGINLKENCSEDDMLDIIEFIYGELACMK